MIKNVRWNKIIDLINMNGGTMTTSDIATVTGVSEVTIRRDLKQLEEQGKLKREHGGAISIDRSRHTEFSTDEKLLLNVEKKNNIGKKLGDLIPNNSTVYLGAGTTLLLAIPYLAAKNIRFVTNSYPAFQALLEYDNQIILTAGEFYRRTGEFLGPIAEASFKDLNIDFALCSTNGISKNRVTTSNSTQGSIQLTAMNCANKKIIVADTSKIGISDMITFAPLEAFDSLVSDDDWVSIKRDEYSKYTNIL
ncbi:lactose phosphotransferase system transcriptional repressor [Streptococcus criceti]|uniref:Lactose phosphotransferase system repressor n=1 Tax=Streptococcus criceti HS-6 TaxID=873449 RepID=G5JTK2_STRCG|nr:DeoR/GlpR family DNA-binding transcription regulator [Streptococcus criceti]EHI73668.1 lactose PTS family porter repressor LacR family protein [Streptococcus criceti HS-6]SUN37674.1 lactose phosphotransferase system transcriptional repressor [Streptococcus criceti]